MFIYSFCKVILKNFLIFLHCTFSFLCLTLCAFLLQLLKFILRCYTPLILQSTHLLTLMQTTCIHSFYCNLCLLYLLLYCELYASSLLHHFSMHINVSLCHYTNTSTILVLYCELHACTGLHYSFSTPLHLHSSTPLRPSTPLHLYSSTPLRLYASTPLHLYAYTPLGLYTSTPLHPYASR